MAMRQRTVGVGDRPQIVLPIRCRNGHFDVLQRMVGDGAQKLVLGAK